jgi:hypothetical protein
LSWRKSFNGTTFAGRWSSRMPRVEAGREVPS